ncbi:hypothetical protein MVEN_02301200 [Mycena venus]|uniref:Uncharacterized protein n=1 Tax=Mycena venus TaxID=2733690 RepID=A0A8H7CEV9_9AGAR|nr:hypothetical protein MVEN_02301200 [Mycena venus]
MSAVESRDKTLASVGPTFENPCGRRGCAHIFQYAGTNPFHELATLVAQHAPECVGRICSTIRPSEADWEAGNEPLDLCYEEEDDVDMCYGFCQPNATDFTDSAEPIAMDDPYLSEEDMDVVMDDFEDEFLLKSISASVKGKRTAASEAGATQTSDTHVTAKSAMTAPSTPLPRKKKGARTEAQRRALLEGDPWTTIVEPHYVGCRGCERHHQARRSFALLPRPLGKATLALRTREEGPERGEAALYILHGFRTHS